jgi:hypothetical protein
MRRRHRPIRPPQTGLPDATVEWIVTEVVRQRGYFDLDLALVWLAAERQARSQLLFFPMQLARESAPSGAA